MKPQGNLESWHYDDIKERKSICETNKKDETCYVNLEKKFITSITNIYNMKRTFHLHHLILFLTKTDDTKILIALFMRMTSSCQSQEKKMLYEYVEECNKGITIETSRSYFSP